MAITRPTNQLSTHLAYGEGPSEEAFLKHLRRHFHTRGSGFRIEAKSDKGGSPGNVVAECIAVLGIASYQNRMVLMDDDLEWTEEHVQGPARKHRIALLSSTPCIEGLLLGILGQPTPSSSVDCKRCLKEAIGGASIREANILDRHFPKDLLITKSRKLPTLAALIRFFETSDVPDVPS